MRFFLLFGVYGILAAALQGTWLARVPTGVVHVDLVIMALIALSFTEEWRRALPIIVLLGALVDAASFAPFGTTVFSYVMSYVAMRIITSQVAFQAGFGRFFWIAALSFVEKLFSGLLMLLWTADGAILGWWFQRAFFQMLLDAVVGFVLVPCLIWYGGLTWEKMTRPRGLECN